MRCPQPLHHTLKGISKRMTRMPWSSFFARSRSGCCPCCCTMWESGSLATNYSIFSTANKSDTGQTRQKLNLAVTNQTHLINASIFGVESRRVVEVISPCGRQRAHAGELGLQGGWRIMCVPSCPVLRFRPQSGMYCLGCRLAAQGSDQGDVSSSSFGIGLNS